MPSFSLDELWQNLQNSGSQCTSLLKKHLTPYVFNKYKNTVTNYGGSLKDCIQSGK